MRLLVDMNLSPKWTDLLNQAGHDAEHWSRVGNAAASDADILAYARRQSCVVLTQDRDFGIELALGGWQGPSVIQVPVGSLRIEQLGPPVLHTLRQTEDQLRNGAFVAIENNRTRLRVLPLLLAEKRRKA